MKLKFKKLHPDATIPEYMTEGSVGFDLHSIENKIIWLSQIKLIKTGLAVEIPKGYEMTVRQRSGMSLLYPNYITISIGTIDSDYRGEIMVPIICRNIWYMKIKKGDRIAQGVISPIEKCYIVETEYLHKTSRGSGGFGHTGTGQKN